MFEASDAKAAVDNEIGPRIASAHGQKINDQNCARNRYETSSGKRVLVLDPKFLRA
jgi:hypothetical protein